MIDTQKTAQSTPILLLPEVKEFLRIDYDEDDALLEALILQAKDLLEETLDRSLTDNLVVAIVSARSEFILPYGPALNINFVKKQSDGEDIEFEYDGLRLTLTVDETFVVNYYTQASVPDGLLLAWQQVVAFLYENRGDTVNLAEIPRINQVLYPYRNRVWI